MRKETALGAAGIAAAVTGWWLASLNVPAHFLPSPAMVLGAMAAMVADGSLLTNFGDSLLRIVGGYILTVACAVPLGVAAGSNRTIASLIVPLNDFLRYIPTPAFVPLAILWVGIGTPCQVFLIFLGTFFPLLVLVIDSTAACPAALRETAMTLGVSRSYTTWRIMFRHASPQIFDYCRSAFGWAWLSLLIAEIVAANSGIGHLIMNAQRYLRSDQVFAGIVFIGLFGMFADSLFRRVHKKLFIWDGP